MEKFSSEVFTFLREDMEDALKEVEEKYGIQFNIGNIRYSEYDANIGLKAIIGSSKTDAEKALWNKNCSFYGLKPEDYKKKIIWGGRYYFLVGFNPKAKKYPILVEDDKGKRFKLTIDSVNTINVSTTVLQNPHIPIGSTK